MTPTSLVGCGVLEKEVVFLIKKNEWPVTCHFSCSSLHTSLGKLRENLENDLKRHKGEGAVVFYGACHPLMRDILREYRTRRTRGQNCVEMLMGRDRFIRELSAGAFFLLEDWAMSWRSVVAKVMGDDLNGCRIILQELHKYILAVRTPLSNDFTQEAERFSQLMELPLRWVDVKLDRLEGVLRELLVEKGGVNNG